MNRSLIPTCRLALLLLAAALPACRGGAAANAPSPPAEPATAPPASVPSAAAQPPAPAPQKPGGKTEDDVSIEDFTAPLAVYGAWVDVAPYGRVWQPGSETVGQDFMPYGTDGHWAVNDDGDWVFEGKHDETFGWATYHYGRWVQDDEYGWVWVPGTAWAPAWVAWRFGGGYVGWAPAAPGGAGAVQEHWVVVEERRFLEDGAIRGRLDGERLPGVLSSAPLLVQTRGDAPWVAGPPVEHFKGLGLSPKVAHAGRPGPGETRAKARAVALRGACKAPVQRQAKKKGRKGKGRGRKVADSGVTAVQVGGGGGGAGKGK